MTGRKVKLAELQLAIVQVLWDEGEATVARVREALQADDRPLAHTTIATMLSRMESLGYVAHGLRTARTFIERRSTRKTSTGQWCRIWHHDCFRVTSHKWSLICWRTVM